MLRLSEPSETRKVSSAVQESRSRRDPAKASLGFDLAVFPRQRDQRKQEDLFPGTSESKNRERDEFPSREGTHNSPERRDCRFSSRLLGDHAEIPRDDCHDDRV